MTAETAPAINPVRDIVMGHRSVLERVAAAAPAEAELHRQHGKAGGTFSVAGDRYNSWANAIERSAQMLSALTLDAWDYREKIAADFAELLALHESAKNAYQQRIDELERLNARSLWQRLRDRWSR